MITPDEVRRSNRKTLSICVDSFGRLIVRAPKRCSEEKINAFLLEKEGWIVKKQAEKRREAIPLPTEDIDGYSLLLLGEKVTLRLYDGARVLFEKERGEIYLPRTNARARFLRWCKENAKRIFTAVTAQEAERMGAEYRSVSVTSARTRWGSCSANNALRYSFRLLYCPKEAVRYVVVHELAHTRHKNHSQAFWQEVERYIPDWKVQRKWLKERGILMQIF